MRRATQKRTSSHKIQISNKVFLLFAPQSCDSVALSRSHTVQWQLSAPLTHRHSEHFGHVRLRERETPPKPKFCARVAEVQVFILEKIYPNEETIDYKHDCLNSCASTAAWAEINNVVVADYSSREDLSIVSLVAVSCQLHNSIKLYITDSWILVL